MKNNISSGLKLTFLLHFVVAFILGLLFLLIPQEFGKLVNWPVTEPNIYRVLGAALAAGFAYSSWLAYTASTWEQVKIVVRMEFAWATVGALVTLWALLFAGLPAFGWVQAVILAAFAIAFWIFYNQHQGSPASAPTAPVRKPSTTAAAKPASKPAANRRRR